MNATRIIALLALGSALAATAPIRADGSPQWNRRTHAISILPTSGAPAGVFDIGAHVSVSAGETSVPLDLSTEIVIFVNGGPVETEIVALAVEPCPDCQPFQLPCVCTLSVPPVCACGELPLKINATGVQLEPGDEIMVLLRPAPGALPDDDDTDDQMVKTHGGDGLWWNRRIESVALVQASGPGGPSWSVEVEVDAHANYDGVLDLRSEIEVLVNGVSVGATPVPHLDLPLTWSICAGNCTAACVFNETGAPLPGGCSDEFAPCECVYDPVGQTTIQGIDLDPDDELIVILRPVPGALPELPGFPDDEEEPRFDPCDADFDGNGVIGFADLNALLQAWGPCAGCPEDLDGNGTVGFADLNLLLGAWGICAPV